MRKRGSCSEEQKLIERRLESSHRGRAAPCARDSSCSLCLRPAQRSCPFCKTIPESLLWLRPEARRTTLHKLTIEEPICIAATGDVCGEGVCGSGIHNPSIGPTSIDFWSIAICCQDGIVKTWFFSEPVTCVMETNRRDTLALSLGSGIALWKPESHEPHYTVVCSSRLALCSLQRCRCGSRRSALGGDDAQQCAGKRRP